MCKNTDEFKKVVKVLVIKNGFRLERVTNEKVRVTFGYAAARCTWSIPAGPN